jgi:hypothetical protein
LIACALGRGYLGFGAVAVAFPEMKRNLIECALLPLPACASQKSLRSESKIARSRQINSWLRISTSLFMNSTPAV